MGVDKMADDNEVRISFGASVDGALDGIDKIRDALGSLTAPISGLNSDLDRVQDAFAAALPVSRINEAAQAAGSLAVALKSASSAQAPKSGIGEAIADFSAIQQAALESMRNFARENATAIREGAADASKATQQMYARMIKSADDAYAQTASHLNAEVRLHEIAQDEKTQKLLSALEVRNQKEQAAFAIELSQLPQGSAEYDRVLKERSAKYDAYVHEKQKVTEKAAEEEAKEWKQAADQVAGAFNSQLRGLLAGTTTWSKAMKSISADLVLKFLEDQVKLSLEWLASQARILAGHIAAETGMTAATTAGASLRAAANVASGQTSILETLANALKSIFASAGQTAAAVSANVAPEAGPAAPAIGAAAGAAVVATATGMLYEKGTDYIVRGGLAVLHPGEMVVPAGMNAAKGTGPYSGGGMGGLKMGDVHIHTQPGQNVDHTQLAREILKQTRQRGVFAPNKLRMA